MKILICICTYKRNFELIKCLESFGKVILPNNINLNFLICDNTVPNLSYQTVKKFKKKFKFPIIHFNEKKRGVVYARNKCLKELKKISCNYIAFFDDDCVVDKNWFKNFLNIKKISNSEIVTGPQIHQNKLANLFEKNYKNKIQYVKWAATNNVLIKKSILIKENMSFDYKLNKFGMGEDQLFFLKLKKKGYEIIWSRDLKVFEKPHKHRFGLNWIKNRSFRLGLIGFYIENEINGKIIGTIFNFAKIIYFLSFSFLSFVNITKKNNFLESVNFFYRAFGRILGPIKFKNISFYKS